MPVRFCARLPVQLPNLEVDGIAPLTDLAFGAVDDSGALECVSGLIARDEVTTADVEGPVAGRGLRGDIVA